MKKSAEKTNALRMLSRNKLAFTVHDYTESGAVSGPEVARVLGEDPEKVFKTLVTVGKSGGHYVCLVPVERELDLRKAAACFGEKKLDMLPQKELLPLTGYVHGGCSPIGMNKPFRTTVDETVSLFDSILFSGGRRGEMVEVAVEGLRRLVPFGIADVTRS